MKKVDTLIFARWLIPVEPESVVWENQSIAIEKGKIVDILPVSDAKNAYQADDQIELNHHLVMPGLVNAHSHSPMVLLRGFGDDLPLMDWLNHVIWPAERNFLSPGFVRDGTELALGEMIRSGTTCFNEHYFFPETIAQVTDEVGMRARIGAVLIETENPWSKNLDESIQKAIELHKFYQQHPLVSIGLAPHASYTLSDTALKKIKMAIQTYGFPLHIHMHETQAEIEQDWVNYKKRPLKRFYDAELLSDRCQLIHMTQTNAEDIEILKNTLASVVHCPSSNLKLASGICPVQTLLSAGVNVALGTDGAASNNTVDLFQAIYLAALVGKMAANDASAVNAMTALKMATIYGAKALGLENEIGSLRTGKSADLIAVDMNRLNAQPLYHPISQMVYAANSAQVSDVWVRGRALLKQGKLTTLNETKVLDKVEAWRKKICAIGV